MYEAKIGETVKVKPVRAPPKLAKKERVEELMESYARGDLDEMAETLGLNSTEYPNKASIARAILGARKEQREKERIERERKAHIQELKRKMVEKTVKGKIAANQAYAESFQPTVEEQSKENKEAVAAVQSTVKRLMQVNQTHVQNFQPTVKEQAGENNAYMKSFESSVKAQVSENRKAVAAMQPPIRKQMKENQEYVKRFFG